MVPDERTQARKCLRARVTHLLETRKSVGKAQFFTDGFKRELEGAERALRQMNAEFRERHREVQVMHADRREERAAAR